MDWLAAAAGGSFGAAAFFMIGSLRCWWRSESRWDIRGGLDPMALWAGAYSGLAMILTTLGAIALGLR